MQLQAIFFDLFETLITEFGPFRPSFPSIVEFLGADPRHFNPAWKARYHAHMAGAYPDLNSLVREICLEIDYPVDDERVALLEAQRRATKAIPFSHVENALIDILRAIHEKHIKLGVISNCAPEEVVGWNSSPLAPLFDDVIFSYQVRCVKPEARIYQLACDRLQVNAEQALFIGDGSSYELEGAAYVGITAYHALWFYQQWPEWRRARDAYALAYPPLRSLHELSLLAIK